MGAGSPLGACIYSLHQLPFRALPDICPCWRDRWLLAWWEVGPEVPAILGLWFGGELPGEPSSPPPWGIGRQGRGAGVNLEPMPSTLAAHPAGSILAGLLGEGQPGLAGAVLCGDRGSFKPCTFGVLCLTFL